MTKDDEIYYSNYFEMFNTAGWKQYVEDLEDACDMIEKAAMRTTRNDVVYDLERGKVLQLQAAITFQQSLENSYESVMEDTDANISI